MIKIFLKLTLVLLLITGMMLPAACSSTGQFELSTSVEPGGAGTVSPGGTYDKGTNVRIKATPAQGYVFDGWSGDSTESSSALTITMNSDKSLVAHFKLGSGGTTTGGSSSSETTSDTSQGTTTDTASGTTGTSTTYLVTIAVTPENAGTVSPVGGIYTNGTVLTLTATPAAAYNSVRWEGDVSGNSKSVTFVVNSNKSILVHFETANASIGSGNYTLTTYVSPDGGGIVTPSGGSYEPGTYVKITALASENYAFHHWSGAITGISPSVTVRMTGDKSVVANFQETGKFTLHLDSLTIDDYIPDIFTCEGDDISPYLYWSSVPYGTKSFALIVEDPDAKSGVFTHWVVYNIPETSRQLQENMPKDPNLADGTQQGMNSYNKIGYGGPCPPRGEMHQYIFTIYALDTTIDFPPEAATREAMHTEIQSHILGTAQVTGFYTR